MSIREKTTVLMARRADLCGQLAVLEGRPTLCRDHARIALLKTELNQIARHLETKRKGAAA